MMELINPPSILKCRVCHHLCLGFPHSVCGSLLASWLHKEANHNQLEPVPIYIGVDSAVYWDPNTLCLPSSIDHPHSPSTRGRGVYRGWWGNQRWGRGQLLVHQPSGLVERRPAAVHLRKG